MATKRNKRQKIPFKKIHEEEYGLRIIERDPKTQETVSVVCRFCESFGKENTVAHRKRKQSEHVKYFTAPFRVDNYKSHFHTCHPVQSKEYAGLSRDAKRSYFDRTARKAAVPFANRIDSHLERGTPFSFVVDEEIVDVLIKKYFSGASSDDECTGNDEQNDEDYRSRLPKWFTKCLEDRMYKVSIASKRQFEACRRAVAVGISFRGASRVVREFSAAFGVGSIGSTMSQDKVRSYVRTAVSYSLQAIAEVMRSSWAFSISFDAATNQTNSYLDIRVRLYHREELWNMHLLALPMYERHTGKYMYDLIEETIGALDRNWKKKVIGVTTDGAASMTGEHRGVVSLIEREVLPNMFRIWCGLHQLDIVVQKVTTGLVITEDSFFHSLTSLIGHLRGQKNLIVMMKSKCPKVATTRWLSLGKVSCWLMQNLLQIRQHLTEKMPTCTPSTCFWVLCCDSSRHERN